MFTPRHARTVDRDAVPVPRSRRPGHANLPSSTLLSAAAATALGQAVDRIRTPHRNTATTQETRRVSQLATPHDTASRHDTWWRFAHSLSVSGVMAGIAIGLWAAPTLAHWQVDPGLRSATLSVPASGPSRERHWVRVTDQSVPGTPTGQANRAGDTPPAPPDHAFAVPRGDLRKDISDANRDAGPRGGFGSFGGH